MNLNHICMNCMKERPGADVICPYCGFNERVNLQKLEYLDYWTVLRGQYLVGRCMGQGGFGITYVGFDMNLEIKVAIKEYFPYGYASRRHDVSAAIAPRSATCKEYFMQEKSAFIEEARILAMCNDLPGIVKVRDYFQENATCYIVMEFVEGVTLKDYIKECGGRVPAETVFRMMEPVIRSMIQIHEHGVIHKDISPDNIMIGKNGRVKLIDFGAAQREQYSGNTLNTYKERFSPPEQRNGTWKVDTYSDIYAFCATMYYAMTGYAPDDALDRLYDDCLQKPSELGAQISPVQEVSLMKGLELQPEDRICDAKDLYYFLYMYGQNNEYSDRLKQNISSKKTEELTRKLDLKRQSDQKKKWIFIAVAILSVLIFAHFMLQDLIHLRRQQEGPLVFADMSEYEQKEMADEIIEEAIRVHQVYGTLKEDFELNQKADEVAKVIGKEPIGILDWDEFYREAMEQVYEKDGDEFYWIIIPVTEETETSNVLQQGLTDKNNSAIFEQCDCIGASVVYNPSGYLFYIIILK